MTKKYNIPSDEQLFKLALFLNEEFKDIKTEKMSVCFELSKDLLKQVDENFYYKNNGDKGNFIPSDEVEVIINGIKIKFFTSDEEVQKE